MSSAVESWVKALRRDGFVVTMRGGTPGADRDAARAEWTEEDRRLWARLVFL
jgi:hypothetical protein